MTKQGFRPKFRIFTDLCSRFCSLLNSLNQHKIDLVERERELDDLRTLHEPTKRNYSQLISEYNNVVASLKNLQTALNKTTEAYEALKVTYEAMRGGEGKFLRRVN